MATSREAGQDEQYGQAPDWVTVLMGSGPAGASASPSPEDAGHPPGGARRPAGTEPDVEPATAETAAIGPDDQGPWYRLARARFRQWRRTRPFWAGVLCLLGGVLMAYGPLSVFRYVLVAGTVIWAGVLIGLLVCAMGLFLWLTPQFRQIVGILAAIFSVVSLITSNLGGFILGLLLGAFGGAMGFAWTPVPAQGAEAQTQPRTPAPGGRDDAHRDHQEQQADQGAHGAHSTGSV